MNLLHIVLEYFFIQNLALVFGLGMAGVIGGKAKYRFSKTDFLAVAIFLFVALVVSWGVSRLVVDFFGFGFLQTLVLVLVLIALLKVLEPFVARLRGSASESLMFVIGPLGLSSAAMGLMVLVNGNSLGILEALIAGVGSILGYGAALGLHGGIMRRMELEWIPPAFRGVPFALISLGFVALVFSGISSLVLSGIR